MNKSVKIILGLCTALFLALLSAGFYLSRNLPEIAKTAVETYVPQATGTPVKLDAVAFNFMTGTMTLHHFVVGNPPGFSSDHAFEFDALKFSLDLPTVLDKVIVIREFSINGADIIAEQHGAITHTNLQEIADHAKNAPVPAVKDAGKPDKGKSSESQKLIVSKLALTNNVVELGTENFGSYKIKLPDIVLTDVGRKEGGLTPDQLTQHIMQLIITQASDAVREELKNNIVKKGRSTLDGLKSLFGR